MGVKLYDVVRIGDLGLLINCSFTNAAFAQFIVDQFYPGQAEVVEFVETVAEAEEVAPPAPVPPPAPVANPGHGMLDGLTEIQQAPEGWRVTVDPAPPSSS